MRTMSSICVIIPTYNERENLPRVAAAVLRRLPPHGKIIVVDDNSPDGTGRIADELAAADRRVQVIHRPVKAGLGSAYRAGFAKALADDAELIVTMDSDLSHDPDALPAILAKAGDADLVIGSRYCSGGKIVNWSPWRRLLSRTANLVARLALGLKPHDSTSGFRCYRRAVLEGIPLDGIKSEGYSFLEEVLFRSQRAGFRAAEVPIVFRDRTGGSSKISRSEIFKAVWTVLRLAFCA